MSQQLGNEVERQAKQVNYMDFLVDHVTLIYVYKVGFIAAVLARDRQVHLYWVEEQQLFNYN